MWQWLLILFINKGDICILRPDDVYHLSEEGTGGKFIYKTEDEQILVEGTYQIEWASLGGKQKRLLSLHI